MNGPKLRSVPPPARPTEQRSPSAPPPGRVDGQPRTLSAERQAARELERPALKRAVSKLSDADLAEHLGVSPTTAAKLRHGQLPLTLGEVLLTLPLDVAAAVMADLLHQRITRELVATTDAIDALPLRLASGQVDQLAVSLAAAQRPRATRAA
jgi:hypothetical protein